MGIAQLNGSSYRYTIWTNIRNTAISVVQHWGEEHTRKAQPPAFNQEAPGGIHIYIYISKCFGNQTGTVPCTCLTCRVRLVRNVKAWPQVSQTWRYLAFSVERGARDPAAERRLVLGGTASCVLVPVWVLGSCLLGLRFSSLWYSGARAGCSCNWEPEICLALVVGGHCGDTTATGGPGNVGVGRLGHIEDGGMAGRWLPGWEGGKPIVRWCSSAGTYKNRES